MTDLSLRIFPHHIYCGLCGSLMIKRVPKIKDDWDSFYGCRNFPDCRGIRMIYPNGEIEPEIDPLEDLRWIFEGIVE